MIQRRNDGPDAGVAGRTAEAGGRDTQQHAPALVLLERHDDIAVVIMNRPAKLNAMTRPMWQALGDTVAALSSDDSVRCVIIRGAGEKAFSPGNDIAEFETERANKQQAIEYGRTMHATASALAGCRHPVIAQIHGICVGGGLEIAALCDIRICGESSRFGAPIKNLGLVMAYQEMAPLIRLTGPDVALEILLEGRIFDAREAKDKGLVTRIVPDDEVADAAMASACRIADGAPLVARWHKQFVRRLAEGRPVSPQEYEECFDCFDTEDFRRGYAAFLAKQKPTFIGR